MREIDDRHFKGRWERREDGVIWYQATVYVDGKVFDTIELDLPTDGTLDSDQVLAAIVRSMRAEGAFLV